MFGTCYHASFKDAQRAIITLSQAAILIYCYPVNRFYFGDDLKWLSDRKVCQSGSDFPDASVDLVFSIRRLTRTLITTFCFASRAVAHASSRLTDQFTSNIRHRKLAAQPLISLFKIDEPICVDYFHRFIARTSEC